MAVTGDLKTHVRARPGLATAILSVVGYALVIGTFSGTIDVYPELADETVYFLAHVIAVVNTLALSSLVAGVYFIANGEVRKHGTAMLVAFALILLFLVVYLLKIGGGFERSIIAPDLVRIVYLIMLAIHILLSIVAMPVVIYVVLLGLTHTPAELTETMKARVGRIAAFAWILSLFLGIVTYLLLNHAYGSEPREALLLLVLVPWEVCLPGGLRSYFDSPNREQ
jgi:putative membrane protein